MSIREFNLHRRSAEVQGFCHDCDHWWLLDEAPEPLLGDQCPHCQMDEMVSNMDRTMREELMYLLEMAAK